MLPFLGTMGIMAIVGMILTTVAVFTDGWFAVTVQYYRYSVTSYTGIVPYQPNAVGWFQAVSWMMYFAVGLNFFVVIALFPLGHLYRRHGGGHRLRHWIHMISAACTLAGVLGLIAFIIFMTNYRNGYVNTPLFEISAAYSVYLALVGAIFSNVAAIAGGSLARRIHNNCY
ncbi:unnamed protein product [Caenorhabditis auriculariae]|uniref:Uncharacterized protein n=1 Tax=Caenorhabditis auriculariae TaxID=2777116 RepID=A0A8S1HBV3_9PELO|nr:unnamed protein product [Caenorhabditis auriculariae]